MRVRGRRCNADVTRCLNNRRRGKSDTDDQARCLCADGQSVVCGPQPRDVGQVLQLAAVGRRLHEPLHRVDSSLQRAVRSKACSKAASRALRYGQRCALCRRSTRHRVKLLRRALLRSRDFRLDARQVPLHIHRIDAGGRGP